jgi:2-C-methyl-D-erythritol 2,4-cyclodiphosphate synthase
LSLRVGLGYDIHPLVPGRALVLGGETIEHGAGLDGHSDADVLTHAVIDAVLGAAALGNIGELFPDDDPGYEGASSLELLAAAARKLGAAGYHAVNIDGVITAQAPRLQPHLRAMAGNLARRLAVDEGAVSVKATSPEGLGTAGRHESIAAQAVALVESNR